MEGNMNSGPFFGFELPAVLALPVPSAEDRCTRTYPCRREAVSQPIRVALSGGSNPKGIVKDVLLIKAGEDIGEKVSSYFQDQKKSDKYRDHERFGLILSAIGTIWCPTINVQGAAVSFEGRYDIISLAGFFSIPKNGQVEPSGSLKLVFPGSQCDVYGGSVIGPLVAADPVQVVLGSFVHEAE